MKIFASVKSDFKRIIVDHDVDWEKPVQWEIQRCVYNTYNECTFMLVSGPNDKSYIVVTPCNTIDRDKNYGSLNQYFERTKTSKILNLPLCWNHTFCEAEGGIPEIQKTLMALPFREIEAGSHYAQFAEFIEYGRYCSRQNLAEVMGAAPDEIERFVHTDMGTKELYRKEHSFFRDYCGQEHEVLLNQEDTQKKITKICRDFGVKPPKNTKLINNKNWRRGGDYNRRTTNMRLKYNHGSGRFGVEYSTLLHELSHHIDHTFLPEKPAAAHGHRFRQIYVHLLYHYMDVPLYKLQSEYINPIGQKFLENEIIRRDFGQVKLYDIPLPERDAFLPGSDQHKAPMILLAKMSRDRGMIRATLSKHMRRHIIKSNP